MRSSSRVAPTGFPVPAQRTCVADAPVVDAALAAAAPVYNRRVSATTKGLHQHA
jgi:hypothetical protein